MDKRKCFFTQHLVKLWNSLPQDVVIATLWKGVERIPGVSMATSPDGSVLPPVFEAVRLCAPLAGEHGWEGAVAPCPALLVPGRQLVGHSVDRVLD